MFILIAIFLKLCLQTIFPFVCCFFHSKKEMKLSRWRWIDRWVVAWSFPFSQLQSWLGMVYLNYLQIPFAEKIKVVAWNVKGHYFWTRWRVFSHSQNDWKRKSSSNEILFLRFFLAALQELCEDINIWKFVDKSIWNTPLKHC